jgi:hypothetical protein
MRTAALRAEVEQILATTPIDFGGGCSASKATVLAQIIRTQRVTRSIDLGIYRGRSFFPQALAHRSTGGTVFGVDPYSAFEAAEHDHPELAVEIANFVATTDWDGLYNDVVGKLGTLQLADHAEILRTTSNAAFEQLSSHRYGLIHVDGNHDTSAVMGDVEKYSQILEPNGFLVLDDISWTSVKPATNWVQARFTLLYARVDTWNDYAVFWNGSGRRTARLRAEIAAAGER